jgi:hypothetical protein
MIYPEQGDTDQDLDRVLCPAISDRKIAGRQHIDVTGCLPTSSVKAMRLGPYNSHPAGRNDNSAPERDAITNSTAEQDAVANAASGLSDYTATKSDESVFRQDCLMARRRFDYVAIRSRLLRGLTAPSTKLL